MESHLLQMRGLKQAYPALKLEASMSHLLQMRGLKPYYSKCRTCPLKSHLLQMRGLKPNWRRKDSGLSQVASFTDAWIETPIP